MRATRVTPVLLLQKNAQRQLIDIVQNPTGWPAFAGHDIGFEASTREQFVLSAQGARSRKRKGRHSPRRAATASMTSAMVTQTPTAITEFSGPKPPPV